MVKRLILTAAVFVLGMTVLSNFVYAQERETQNHSGGAFLGIAAEGTSEGGQQEGATVISVSPNSPAAKAGIKRGDIITKIGQKEIRNFDDLANIMSQHHAGDKLKVEVTREGQEKQLTVTLSQRPRGGFQEGADQGAPSYYGRRRPTAFLGVQTEELTSELRRREGISAQQGAVVTEVFPNTPAEQAGLQEGDVITKVNGETISTPDDLRETIQNAGPNHEVTLTVMRGKRQRQFTAQLEEGSVEMGPNYGAFFNEQNREIQKLRQRIQQLEQRLQRLEQNRQNQQQFK